MLCCNLPNQSAFKQGDERVMPPQRPGGTANNFCVYHWHEVGCKKKGSCVYGGHVTKVDYDKDPEKYKNMAGGKAEAKPRHILVITDPYSHMVWLETIITKSAEEVHGKFVDRFLLEEGCPKVILTDNGQQFSNQLLRELMRLYRIRLKYTPPYHPRGNFTERANRFVGESPRAMVSPPSGRKQDWYKLGKFVQFAYRRMLIPGTSLTPYMVARGRQPISPNEVDLVDEEGALLTGPSLDEHNKAPVKNLETATKLLTQAREAQ